MEEEQHHHHYGGGAGSSCNTPAMADLRQFFSPIPTHHHQFPPPPPSLYSPAAAAFPHHYDTMMLVMGAAGPGVHDFRSDNSAGCAAATAAMVPASSSAGFDMENAAGAGGGFGLGVGGLDGGATARWPRQETLTLLEIRSRLDHKFKEANHKGPLWDEVSRIMCEEHGYQRSGKKCREKFENLYKYYKKTKEGKAGRQDGKHYRFFRQLEALYGEQPPPNPPSAHLGHLISNYTPTAVKSTSLSNTSSDLDTSSSGSMDGDSDMVGRRSRKRRGWKARIKEFIDAQMRRIVEKQEAWLERMMRSLEHREEERVAREEEWRRQEAARMEREHRFWAKERAWIEARDKALMEALHRITGNGSFSHEEDQEGGSRWGESEMVKLVELRASVQERFDECGGGPGEGGLWDEISTRMACLGHDRSARMCKDKWDFISKELSQKRKEADCNTKYHHHLQTTDLLYNYGPQDMNGQVGPPQIGLGGGGGGGGNPMNDSCLRILLGDGGGETNPWETYGVKLTKGDQTH